MLELAAILVMKNAAHGQWTSSYGTRVSVVFVEPSKKLLWRPDGSSSQFESLPKCSTFSDLFAKTSEPILLAVMNTGTTAWAMPTVRFKLPDSGQLDAGFSLICENRKIKISGDANLGNVPVMQDVAVGIADGPWKVQGWVTYRQKNASATPTASKGVDFSPKFVTDPFPGAKGATSKPGKPTIAVNISALPTLGSFALRVVAKDKSGNEMLSAGSYRPPTRAGSTTYFFEGDVRNIALVRVETRPFEWTTIKAAHFRTQTTAVE